MRKIAVMDTRTIVIGRVGENEAAQVVWPGLLAKWRGLYGEGTVQLAVRRAPDKSPYPAVCAVDGDDVSWTVSAADTAQHGTGECELSYLVGDVVAKSQTWATLTLRSLTGDEPGEPPEDPAKAWFAAIQSQIGDLADLTTKAKDNLVAAINEAAKTGSGGGGSVEMRVDGGYIQYSTDGATWENLIAVADLKGDTATPGQDGYSPSASVTETDDGAEITITDKTGTTTATVKNGKDGAAGAPGKDGVTPNIQIGTVTTLDAGSDATASMTGTAAEPLLNLGIPKGADGSEGGTGRNFRAVKLASITVPTGEAAQFAFETSFADLIAAGYTSIVIFKSTTNNSGYSYTHYNEITRLSESGNIIRFIPNIVPSSDGTINISIMVAAGNTSLIKYTFSDNIGNAFSNIGFFCKTYVATQAVMQRDITVREADYGSVATGDRTFELWGEIGFA